MTKKHLNYRKADNIDQVRDVSKLIITKAYLLHAPTVPDLAKYPSPLRVIIYGTSDYRSFQKPLVSSSDVVNLELRPKRSENLIEIH